MEKAVLFTIWVGLVMAFALIDTVDAANYYVATYGSNTNPGTLAQPWATPSYAAQMAVAGDTIYLVDGIWTGEHVIFYNSGTSSAPIRMTAYNGTPVLDGVDKTGTGIDTNGKSYIDISWLKITNYDTGARISTSGSIYNITIKNNIINNMASRAIYITGNGGQGLPPYAYYVTITNNDISYVNGDSQMVGAIDIHGLRESLIKNNFIHDTVSGGVMGDWSRDNVIQGNIMNNIGRVFSMFGWWSNNNILRDNIITNGTDRGIRFDYHMRGIQIINNTLKNIAGGGLNIYPNNSAIVRGNYFEDTSVWSGTFVDSIIENNIWVGCGSLEFNFLPGDVVVNNINLTFRNNVLKDCNSYYSNMENSIVKNNIFLNSPIAYNNPISNNIISYNDFYNSPISGANADSTNIYTDPLFVNSAAGDFHLQPNSPAKTAGEGGTEMGAYGGVESVQNNYYVASWGNDANDGKTLATAWATPGYAAQQAKAGNNIYLVDGTWYNEHIVFANSGNATHTIMMSAYNGTPILDGLYKIGYGIYAEDKSYIEISGLTIKNYDTAVLLVSNLGKFAYGEKITNNTIQSTNSHGIQLKGWAKSYDPDIGYQDVLNAGGTFFSSIVSYNRILNAGNNPGSMVVGIELQNVHHSQIKNNNISATSYSSGGGIECGSICVDDTIESNNIIGTGWNGITGSIFINSVFRYNNLTNVNGRGIRCDYECRNNSYTYNRLIKNVDSGFNPYPKNDYYFAYNYLEDTSFYGNACGAQGGSRIENNIFVRNVLQINYGPACEGYINNFTLNNNVFSNNKLMITSWAAGNFKNNICYGCTIELISTNSVAANYNDLYNLNMIGLPWAAGSGNNIAEDPLFANPSSNDFHLKSQYGRWSGSGWVLDSQTSPAIDAGDPTSDYSKEPSYPLGHIEMGAYGNTAEASKSPSGPLPPFDFTLSNSGTITVEQGKSNSNTITTTLTAGSTRPVTFTASGIPSGATHIFSQNSCNPSCTTTLTISTTTVATGTYPITVSATNGTLTKTTNFNLVVNAPSPYTTVTLSPTMDTSIKSGTPDTQRSANAWIDLGRLAGAYGNYRGLLYFDLSQVPSSATINSAVLTLSYEGNNRNRTTTIGVYKPSVQWDNSATWNSRQTGVLWSVAGGDWTDKNGISYGTTPYSEVTYPVGSTQDANFDVKQLVQQYANGTPNTGFFLKANEADNTYISFHSLEAAIAANRPKLVVNYSLGNRAYLDVLTYFYFNRTVSYYGSTAGKQMTGISALPAYDKVSVFANKFNKSFVNFSADAVNGNDVAFTIELKPNTNYLVRKDNANYTTVQADSTGKITFNNSVW